MSLTVPASSFFLDDGLTTHAPTGGGLQTVYGRVSGALRVYDTGSSVVPWHGVCAFMPSVLDQSSGNETYLLVVEGSVTADFSGAKHDLASWVLGVLNPQDVIELRNLYDGVVYRYLRLKIIVAGTTPAIAVLGFVQALSDVDELTLAEVVTLFGLRLTNFTNLTDNMGRWMAGVVGGGPNNDGKYPLTDGLGNTVLHKCLAQIEADADLSPEAFGAKLWVGEGETTGLSLAQRVTHSLITVGYGGAPGAVADDPDYLFNHVAVQAALDRGGTVVLPGPNKRIFMKGRLFLRPAFATIDYNGSKLDWAGSDYWIDPSTLPNLMDDAGALTPGTIANFNIWREDGDELVLRPVGPNLSPHPRYDELTQYLIFDDGPLNNTVYTKGSVDPDKGAYETTFNGVVTLHKVEVLEAPSTQAGTAQFGAAILADEAVATLQAFSVEGSKRYSFGAKVRKLTGAGTGIQVEVFFYSAAGVSLGGGSNVGLTVNGLSASGHVFTNVDSPPTAAFATVAVKALKTSSATGPALVAFDNRFFREIDPACDIAPNYVDAVDNDGDYADVGFLVPEVYSYPLNPSNPSAYLPGSRLMRYKITFNVLELERIGPQKYITVALRAGIGFGSAESTTITEAGSFTWETPAPPGLAVTGGYLTLQSSSGVRIDKGSIRVEVVPENFAMMIQASPDDPPFDHSGRWIGHGYMHGPNLPYAIGRVWDTPHFDRSSRANVQYLQSFGWGIPDVMRTQAYLTTELGCTKGGIDVAELSIPSANAGEQINSVMCVYTGGRVIHDNCFERRLWGGSSDYPYEHRFVTTANTWEGVSHHFEGERPEESDEIPFEVRRGGALRLIGGKIEFAGKNQHLPAVMPVMFRTLHKFSMIDLDRVEASYWQTASDFLADGPGRVIIRNTRGGDTKNLCCFVKDDWRHNKFGEAGDCDTAQIELNMWVEGGTRVSAYETSNIKAEMSTDDPMQGLRSLKITKLTGVGTAAKVFFWFRAPPASIPGLRLHYKIPQDDLVSGSEPVPNRTIFFAAYCTRLLPPTATADFVPGVWRLPSNVGRGFFGEYNHTLLPDGMDEYRRFEASGRRADESIDFDGYTAESDEVVLGSCDLSNMPADGVVYFDRFHGGST